MAQDCRDGKEWIVRRTWVGWDGVRRSIHDAAGAVRLGRPKGERGRQEKENTTSTDVEILFHTKSINNEKIKASFLEGRPLS